METVVVSPPSAVALRRRKPAPRPLSDRPVTRSRGRWEGRPLVLCEEIFRDVVVRERKRADRFDRSFLLVLVALKPGRAAEPSVWASVIDAVYAAKRDTDVLGWFERGSVIGLVLPAFEASDASLASGVEIESRVHRALASRLEGSAQSDFAIRLHRHTPIKPDRQRPENGEPLLDKLHVSTRTRIRSVLKRCLDITASAALLAIVSPLMLLIAVLVKVKSPGPVFFRQVRVGEFGKPFTMLKFRTMRVNNDQAIHKEFVSQLIKGTTPTGSDGKETPFKIVNDPRVTTVGRILRKTSLDELPQLWNVLRGDMALVGPRPPLSYEVEQYKPWHYRRVLEAKPGITGLWQVSGRSRTTFDDMVRLDLRYAKNPSAWTDIKILLATPRAVISGKGAC